MKTCPHCAELAQDAAKTCPHCGRRFPFRPTPVLWILIVAGIAFLGFYLGAPLR